MTRCRIRVTSEVGERATFTFTVPGGQGPSLKWFRTDDSPTLSVPERVGESETRSGGWLTLQGRDD
jgi:hypothetical protein